MRRYTPRMPRTRAFPLPKATYLAQTFVAEDGTEYTVRSGKLPTRDWPTGPQPDRRTIGHPVVTP